MIYYGVLALGALLAALYILMALGQLDEWSEPQLKRLKHGMTALMIGFAFWCGLQGALLVMFICLLMGVPLVRHLLNPDRDRLPPEAAGETITHAEALRVLELDEDELTPEAAAEAYARLLALVPEAKRARSFYARKLLLADRHFQAHFQQTP